MQGSFVRTRRTWLAYLALGYYSYLLNALGPTMPFLRADLRLNYAAGSLHTTAFALGMLAAGLVGDRAVRALGRRTVLLAGIGGLAAGSLLLAGGRIVALTLSGAFLMGALGTLILVLVPAVLADQHGAFRASALGEANVLASTCALLAPPLIGGLARTPLGWRAGLLVSLALLVPLARALRGLTRQDTSAAGASETIGARLPAGYWAYWLVIVCCVSLEFCMIFWAADFFRVVARLPGPVAASLVSVFLGAMLIGRAAGSRLTRAFAAERLLLPSLAIVGVGFPLYWLVPISPVRVAGLFITGVGIANLYPLTLSLAIGAAPGASAAASARATLASALAIGTAPLILGWLADQIGIARAYTAVVALLALALLTYRLARRLAGPSGAATGTVAVRRGLECGTVHR